MENLKEINTRILIGDELGEIYLIIQKFINGKWQHCSNSNYKGTYFLRKGIKELLKYNIHSIHKENKKDLVKFKVEKGISVYINDYSTLKQHPEIKALDRILTKKIIYQKFAKKISLSKEDSKIYKTKKISLFLAGTLSLSLSAGSINFLYNNKEKEVLTNTEKISENNTTNKDETVYFENIIQNITNSNILNNEKIKNKQLPNSTTMMFFDFANIYSMNIEDVTNIYYRNYDEISNAENPKLQFLLMVKDNFYLNDYIDKTPIVSNLTSEEKENCIIDIATKIYKVNDREDLARMLAIHRLESTWGTSRRCVEDNNPAGLIENGEFLTFKTFEIGAECFVRNTIKIKNEAINSSDYDLNQTLEYNIQKIYCPDSSAWDIEVNNLKESILVNNDLDKYIDSNQQKIINYIK